MCRDSQGSLVRPHTVQQQANNKPKKKDRRPGARCCSLLRSLRLKLIEVRVLLRLRSSLTDVSMHQPWLCSLQPYGMHEAPARGASPAWRLASGAQTSSQLKHPMTPSLSASLLSSYAGRAAPCLG